MFEAVFILDYSDRSQRVAVSNALLGFGHPLSSATMKVQTGGNWSCGSLILMHY